MTTPRSRICFLTWLFGLPFSLPAQVAPQERPTSSADANSVITMSPFSVNTDRDTGYLAAGSLAGGRMETALDRTPAAVSVLTREFLDDIAANNFTDAAIWSPNTFLVAPTSDFSDYRVDFRSTNQAGNGTVNYFTFSQTMDSYSTERLEFARGPNSILFGEGNLSGIWTVYLKQPRFRDFGQLQLRADDWGSFRGQIDVNRQFLDGRAAVRAAVLYSDMERYRRPARDDRQGAFLAGAMQLGQNSAVRFEFEYGEQERTWGSQNLFEGAAAWNGTPHTGIGQTPVSGTGLANLSANADYLLYIPGSPELGVLNMRNMAQSTGGPAAGLTLIPGGRPYVPNFSHLPDRRFDIQPPNNLTKTTYYFGTLYFEHRFNDRFYVQLAANRRYRDVSREGANWSSSYRRDPNLYLPGGQPNPNFGQAYVDGEPFVQRQWADPRDFRLTASYRFETSWTQQSFALLATHSRNEFRLTNTRLVRTNGSNPSPTAAANFIRQRFYLERSEGIPYEWSGEALAAHGIQTTYHKYQYSGSGAKGLGLQLSEVGSYFNQRVHTILGVRRDDNDRFSISSTVDPASGALNLTRRDFGDAVTTPSAGLVVYPIRHIGPFFNYSESYVPPGLNNPLIFSNQQPGAVIGNTKEYGFHFNFFDQRVQGTARYYDSLQKGRIVNAPGVNNINAIWNAMSLEGNLLGPTPRDTQDLESTGYEFELVANLTRSWRTLLNFGLPTTKQSNSYPETKAYRAAHLAQWQAATTDPQYTPATQQTIATNLVNLDTAIEAGNDGREQNTALKYTANIYSSYDFREGRLKGFGFGAGANFWGRQIAGNAQGQPFNYIYAPSYYLISGHLSYTGKWRDHRYKIQLNISNLLDNHHVLYTSVARYNAPANSGGVTGDYFAGYRYVDPRKFTLTTTFDF
jgi:outer membrane receptor protein involved in Fe transport